MDTKTEPKRRKVVDLREYSERMRLEREAKKRAAALKALLEEAEKLDW